MEKLNFEQFKADVHRTLISKIDLEKLGTIQNAKAKLAVSSLVQSIISDGKLPLSAAEKEKMLTDLLDEVFGLGPLEALLRDPKVSDILVNSKDRVYIERGGFSRKRTSCFVMTATSCKSSTELCRRWGEEWMSRRRWWTRACLTAPA